MAVLELTNWTTRLGSAAGAALIGLFATVPAVQAAGPRSAAPEIDPLTYAIDERPVAGTSSREEMEFKLAFPVPDRHITNQLLKAVQAAVKGVADGKALKFGAIAGRSYRLDPQFQAFAFRDVYLDTPQMHVLRSKSAYRLRHRWSRLELFLRHRWLPQFSAYNPTRCEIQFKSDYQMRPKKGIVSVAESRFEFRPESEPFLSAGGVPPAPWPMEEYLSYAQSGVFKQWRMQPSYDMVTRLHDRYPGVERFALQPVFEVVTVRNRMHLNMKTPWGSGPNPDQVFIITIDQANVQQHWTRNGKLYGQATPGGPSMLEVEVEIERNTSTVMQDVRALQGQPVWGNQAVQAAAIDVSERAWRALQADLASLRTAIRDEVTTLIGAGPLPLNYKYARLVEELGVRRQMASSRP